MHACTQVPVQPDHLLHVDHLWSVAFSVIYTMYQIIMKILIE